MRNLDDGPPFLFGLMLWLVCDPGLRNEILGDLVEEFQNIKKQEGHREAVRWYRRQVLLSITDLIWFRFASKFEPVSLYAVLAGLFVAFFVAVGLGIGVRAIIPGSGVPDSEMAFNLVSIFCVIFSSVAGSFSASWLLKRSNNLVMIAIGAFVLTPHFIQKNQLPEQPVMMVLLILITIVGLLVGEWMATNMQTPKRERI